jgi:hypothetical protein
MLYVYKGARSRMEQKIKDRLDPLSENQYSKEGAYASALAAELLTARLEYAIGLQLDAAPDDLCVAQCVANECENRLTAILSRGNMAEKWTGCLEVHMEFFRSA